MKNKAKKKKKTIKTSKQTDTNKIKVTSQTIEHTIDFLGLDPDQSRKIVETHVKPTIDRDFDRFLEEIESGK